MDMGANQDSRWGGLGYDVADAMVMVRLVRGVLRGSSS